MSGVVTVHWSERSDESQVAERWSVAVSSKRSHCSVGGGQCSVVGKKWSVGGIDGQ